MQFRVPQFIDVEDKLLGPLTFRQFVYLAGGAGMSFLFYKFLPFIVAIFLILPVAGLSILLAFYKINQKPFIHYLQAGLNYFTSHKLYIWKQRLAKNTDLDKEKTSTETPTVVPMVSSSKLKDLSWSLDIEEKEGQ